MQRIIVIGTSCSGKTQLARRLAAKLHIPHIELDQLYWLPEWKHRPADEFRTLIQEAVSTELWVSCGNFSVVRNVRWNRATHVVWLNYPFRIVFYRALKRTVIRCFTKEELFSGNTESFRQSFLSRDSILWWVLKTYRKNRRRYREFSDEHTYPNLQWIELRHPREAEQLHAKLCCTHD